MTDGRLSARLRAHRGALLVIAVALGAFAVLAISDRNSRLRGGIEEPRATITDCELRPGEGAVVRPDAEPRHDLRMSGCEMIFWNSDEPHDERSGGETHR